MNLCLNIGCGTKPEETNDSEKWLNADLYPCNHDVRHLDLEKTPYDFPSNCFDKVKAYSVFEHINNYEEMIPELIRITKDQGEWDIRVPFPFAYGNDNEFHIRRFRYNSFKKYETNDFGDSEAITIYRKLKVVKRSLSFYNFIFYIFNLFPVIYSNSFLRVIIPAHHIFYKVRVIK